MQIQEVINDVARRYDERGIPAREILIDPDLRERFLADVRLITGFVPERAVLNSLSEAAVSSAAQPAHPAH